MFKVSDLERPESFCDNQGETGEATFQFSGYTGGNTNALSNVLSLQDFKEQVKDIIGIIGTTEQYVITANTTNSVRLLRDGESSLNVWGAFFETTIKWKKI
jgi:hypothetical protein